MRKLTSLDTLIGDEFSCDYKGRVYTVTWVTHNAVVQKVARSLSTFVKQTTNTCYIDLFTMSDSSDDLFSDSDWELGISGLIPQTHGNSDSVLPEDNVIEQQVQFYLSKTVP